MLRARVEIPLTAIDTLAVELLPYVVEHRRDEDGDLELTIIRLWHGWVSRDMRAALDDRDGPLYYQLRSFGPFNLSRLPLGRR